MVWGALGGAAIGAAGAIFSSKQSADAAEENYKHRYQWQVKDLKKAGLNPMLAVSNSPGSVAQPDFQNVGEAAIKGFSAAQQAKLVSEQTQAQRAATNKTIAEAERVEMDNLMIRASPLYQSAKSTLTPSGDVGGPSAVAEEKWRADLSVVTAQAEKLKQDTEVARLNAELAKGELTLQEVKVRYADALAQIEKAYRSAMAEAEAAKVPQAKAEAAFWENAGELGKLAAFIKSILR